MVVTSGFSEISYEPRQLAISFSYGWCVFATLFETVAGPLIMMHVHVDCSWNATYESLLGSTKIFAQPIPLGVRSRAKLHTVSLFRTYLPQNNIFTCLCSVLQWQEMVDFLVDGWEQEGLYD
jgi:hypothetical protein